jgi:transposase
MLLWEEYRADHPEGYGYSRFCELYTRWEGKLSPVMRQRHPAGERLFVDYAGLTIDVIDPETGEVRTAQLFVATLGASNYTYAEATWTQSLPDWIASHERAFAFFGGVTAQVVPDNLRAGVTKACFYDPEINRTYADLAAHYDTAVISARPHKPKDKARVEGAVLLAERWILARLRNRQNPADRLDAVPPAMTINEHDHLLRWRSRSAAAKKALVHCPRTNGGQRPRPCAGFHWPV